MEETSSETSVSAQPAPGPLKAIAGYVVSMAVFALHWPYLAYPAAVFGLVAGRRIFKPGHRGFLLSLIYAAFCIWYQTAFGPYPYSFFQALNQNYYFMSIIIVVVLVILWKKDKAWLGAVLVLIFLIHGISCYPASKSYAIYFFGILIIILARSSGELERLCFVPIALAAFNALLLSGLYSYKGVDRIVYAKHPDLWLKSTGVVEHQDAGPDPVVAVKRYIDKNKKVFGVGRVEKVIENKGSSETFVLYIRSGHTRILVLDLITGKLKRKSFEGVCGGANSDFDLDSSGTFIACVEGGEAVLLDTGMLEWRDTADVNIRGNARVRFGPSGRLFITEERNGILHVLDYDSNGHHLKEVKQLKLDAGTLAAAYLPNRNTIFAMNSYKNLLYMADADNPGAIDKKQIDIGLNMDDMNTDGDFLIFKYETEKQQKRIFVSPDSVAMMPGPRNHKSTISNYFLMPVNLSSSIE